MVFCDDAQLDERGGVSAPDIVIEILLPGNNRKELVDKWDIYEQAGVKEYWIVFPFEQVIALYTLINGRFAGGQPCTIGQTLRSSVLPGFELDLAELFEG
jgi:Uma2 family endonuclease